MSSPASHAKFQQPSKASKVAPGTKTSASGTGIASSAGFGVSAAPKKTGAAGATTGGGTKASAVQVIYNGKIVTPQSLISNQKAIVASTQKKPVGHSVTSIPEHEATDKHSPLKGFKKAPTASEIGGVAPMASRIGHSMLISEAEKKAAEEHCTVILTETPTEPIFFLNSLMYASDLRDVSVVNERNRKYDGLKDMHVTAADSFTARQTQTLNNPQKSQQEMIAPAPSQTFGNQVVAYEITDATGITKKQYADAETSIMQATGTESNAAGGSSTVSSKRGFGVAVQKFVDDTVNVSLVTPGCLLDVDAVNRERPLVEKKEGAGKKRGAGAGTTAGTGVSGPPPTVPAVAAGGHGPSASGVNASGGGSGSNFLAGGVSTAVNPARQTSGTDVAGSSDPNNSGNESSLGAAGHGHHGHSSEAIQDSAQILFEKQAADIMKSPMLLKRLQMIERAVQQNAYHRNQLDYRDLPDVPPLNLITSDRAQVVESVDQLFGLGGGLGKFGGAALAATAVEENDDGNELDEDLGGGKKIKKLFNFYFADLVQGRSVTAMAWNAVNCDLLAVGYGQLDQFADPPKLGEPVDEQLQGGLVLFWSLRNPEYPEKILRTPYPVTALDFSISSPMLLALGMLNGDVCIYDMVKKEDWHIPKESSESIRDATMTHSDPVWQLRWLVRGIEKNETLVSISTDGAVLEWNLKKGLAVSTLMHLKRSGMGEGWISRQAAGLCFDFAPDDPAQATYVVGTEEGSLHKCSVSYNEQYLETFQGHNGPLYRVRFSRNCPHVFLTCSADWSIGLYDIKSRTPLAVMKSSGEDFSINDICWCPGNSTVFAAITADAKLQIWDLAVSNLDPIESYDTSVDDVTIVAKEEVAEVVKEERTGTAATKPGTATTTTRYESRFDRREEEKEPPMVRLMRNLNQRDNSKRMLTSVLFGARSPTVVVGDKRGAVTVYRIFDPLTITHEGPLQQAAKLQRCLPVPAGSSASNQSAH